MLLITEVKVHQVSDGRPCVVNRIGNPCCLAYGSGSEPAMLDYETEYITPRKFACWETGEVYEVGMTRDVQDKIGIPLDAFGDMSQELAEMRHDMEELRRQRDILIDDRDMVDGFGFWDSLLFSLIGGWLRVPSNSWGE